MRSPEEQLYRAISENRFKLVWNLLKHRRCSASTSFDCSSRPTALIHAATLGRKRCLLFLLHHKACVDGRDAHGVTAAMMASERGHVDCLRILAEQGGARLDLADVTGATALMRAARWGKVGCVEYIVEKLVEKVPNDINSCDHSKQTALMHAAIGGHKLCAHVIIKAGADLDLVDTDGNSALMLAVRSHNNACAETLLRSGADVNGVNTHGDAALSLAIRVRAENYTQFVSALLTKRDCAFVDKNSTLKSHPPPDKNGTASRLNAFDINATVQNQRCLHEMIARGENSIVRLMILNGCAPSAVDCRGTFYNLPAQCAPLSPLAVALFSRRADVARYLIACRFLLPSDLTAAPAWRKCLRGPARAVSGMVEQAAHSLDEVSSVLDEFQESAPSLSTLAFVKVSNKLVGTDPGRAERIAALPLPNVARSQLAFDIDAARLCVSCWHLLSLHRVHYFKPCDCLRCHGDQDGGLTLDD